MRDRSRSARGRDLRDSCTWSCGRWDNKTTVRMQIDPFVGVCCESGQSESWPPALCKSDMGREPLSFVWKGIGRRTNRELASCLV